MKKKFAAIVLASVMVSSLMTGCGAAKAPDTEQTDVTEDVTEESTQEVTEPEEEETGMVNPWVDITEEEARKNCARLFKAPDGAEEINWSMCEDLGDPDKGLMPLIQLDFKLGSDYFTARAQQGAAEDADIAGNYVEWTHEEESKFHNWGDGNMTNKLYVSINDSGMVDMITWYDIEIGIAYSLTVSGEDLDGLDIEAVADSMYMEDTSLYEGMDDEGNEETGEVPDTEDHEVTTDISGCDTFTQIVDKLGAGKGYTNVNIGGTDVLLVASGVYEWEEGVFGAIDCEIFAYDDNDGIKYLGYAECGGTAYPLAVKDGYLYCGGNHFVRVFTVKNGELVLVEEAIEGFTEDGKPSIECTGGEEAPHGKLIEEPQKMLDSMFKDLEGAEVLNFDEIKK